MKTMADEEIQAAPADAGAGAAPVGAGTPAPEGKASPADAGTSLTDDAKAPNAEATGWRDTLPDDLKGWAEKFDSPATALKSHRELEKKLGKSVTLPGKDATPEEVQAFHKKLGVPDSAAEYKGRVRHYGRPGRVRSLRYVPAAGPEGGWPERAGYPDHTPTAWRPECSHDGE
jgi:hypothetical protein